MRCAVSFAAFAVLLAGCATPVDPGVLATVGGTDVRVDYVQTLMPPEGNAAVRVAGEPHPLQAALDLAVRDELLSREAERRDVPGETRAEQLAALVAAERAATPVLESDSISDADARVWYASHRALFDEVDTARVSWAQFGDEDAAREAFRRGAAHRTRPVRSLVRVPTDLQSSGVASIHHDEGAEEMVLRITNAVRRPGGLGLDEEPETGTWFLVRVESLVLEPTPWNRALADRVRAAMAWEREQDHLAAMADGLRERWPVHVFSDRVQALTD